MGAGRWKSRSSAERLHAAAPDGLGCRLGSEERYQPFRAFDPLRPGNARRGEELVELDAAFRTADSPRSRVMDLRPNRDPSCAGVPEAPVPDAASARIADQHSSPQRTAWWDAATPRRSPPRPPRRSCSSSRTAEHTAVGSTELRAPTPATRAPSSEHSHRLPIQPGKVGPRQKTPEPGLASVVCAAPPGPRRGTGSRTAPRAAPPPALS